MSDELMGNYFPLIQSTMEHFEIQEDIDTCDRTEQTFQRIQEKRKILIDESLDSLRSLTRKVELSKAKLDSLANSNTHQKVSHQIIQLDREKFSIAKSLNELEQSNTTNQTTLDILRQEFDDLKEKNVTEEATNQYINNSAILKLRFYRSLGIKFHKEGESGEESEGGDKIGEKEKETETETETATDGAQKIESGDTTDSTDKIKVLIQSSSENRIHVFSFDSNYSNQFVSNYIWEHM